MWERHLAKCLALNTYLPPFLLKISALSDNPFCFPHKERQKKNPYDVFLSANVEEQIFLLHLFIIPLEKIVCIYEGGAKKKLELFSGGWALVVQASPAT